MHTTAMLLLIVIGLSVIFAAPTAAPPPEIASEQVRLPKGLSMDAQQKSLAEFWTADKMKKAKSPSELYPDMFNKQFGNSSSQGKSIIFGEQVEQIIKATSPSTPQSKLAYPGVRPTIGKVFWNIGNGYYGFCSASIIPSDSRDMIITAGHCIHDGTKFLVNNQWAFVPGYKNGVAPYGIWPARRMSALVSWTQGRNYNSDVGMVSLSTPYRFHIQDYLGSNGLIFNAKIIGYTPGLTGSPPAIYSFGYPLNLANGQTLQYCGTPAKRSPYTQNGYIGLIITCDMTGGCSGGPWLNSNNQVFSVNSFGITSFTYSNLNGPYLEQTIYSLYNACKAQ